MANNAKGERKITFVDEDEKKSAYTLKFTTSAICGMEEDLEMESGEIEQKLRLGSVRILRMMLWHGTRKYHRKEITRFPDDVNELLDSVEDMEEFVKALSEAYQAGMPGAAAREEASENGSPKASKKKLAAVSDGESS